MPLTLGYLQISLDRRSDNYQTLYVHRLVAFAFLPKPFDVECDTVNHIDFDKSNNRLDNLEWVTRMQNSRHGFESMVNEVIKLHKRGYSNKKITKTLFIGRKAN